jgi:hypothetical protein
MSKTCHGVGFSRAFARMNDRLRREPVTARHVGEVSSSKHSGPPSWAANLLLVPQSRRWHVVVCPLLRNAGQNCLVSLQKDGRSRWAPQDCHLGHASPQSFLTRGLQCDTIRQLLAPPRRHCLCDWRRGRHHRHFDGRMAAPSVSSSLMSQSWALPVLAQNGHQRSISRSTMAIAVSTLPGDKVE